MKKLILILAANLALLAVFTACVSKTSVPETPVPETSYPETSVPESENSEISHPVVEDKKVEEAPNIVFAKKLRNQLENRNTKVLLVRSFVRMTKRQLELMLLVLVMLFVGVTLIGG